MLRARLRDGQQLRDGLLLPLHDVSAPGARRIDRACHAQPPTAVDGHYINNKSIPAGAKWIEDANFFNWAISAGSRSELLGLGDLHGCSNPESSRCIFQRGGDAVDYYGFRDKPFRKAITAIMLISVALRALAFIAFKFLFTGRPVFDTCTKKQ